MKECPRCKRSYADDTISFCLADGELLSQSYYPGATLKLTRLGTSDDAVTEVLPVASSPEGVGSVIRRNWIAGAVGIPIGVIIMMVTFSNAPDSQNQPITTLIVAAALSGVIHGYIFWSAFWGFPKVWSWWRLPVRKLYQLATRIEFSSAVSVVLILGGICALVPGIALVLIYFYSLFWVGLFYSFFGGGVYQFLQARRLASAK